jgi:zinc transporter ZupT
MSQNFWTSFVASSLAALTTTCGIYVIRRQEAWARRNMTYFMCFASGVLVSASLVHLIPEAVSMSGRAPTYLLSGFLAFYLFNWFFTAHVCERGKLPEARIGWIALFGIGFHSLIDGFIYSISFAVSVSTGFLATVGMVLHEFPEGIVTYLLLLRGGFAPRKAFLAAFVAAALTTPVGMLVSYPLVSHIRGEPLGNLLAFSAGALIYVGASHLLPETERDRNKYNFVAFMGGVIVTLSAKLLHH